MTKLTKKYIFQRRLDGKPIIIYIDKGFAGWATKEDAKLLQTFGIIVPYDDDRVICTHEIITHVLPFNPHNGSVAQIEKGQLLYRSKKTTHVVDL